MSSSFAGREFFDRSYVEAHPDLHFQHRGKGRWYIVPGADATVPPPQQAMKKLKAEKKINPAIKPEDDIPKEPKATRKRRPVTELDEQPVLKATRTRNGSARNTAIDVGAEAPKVPDETPKGSKRKQSPNADEEDISDEIPVASAKLPPKTKPKPKPKAKASPKQKKMRAVPKPRIPRSDNEMLNYNFVPTASVPEKDAMSDTLAMGITKEEISSLAPEPVVDSATQITTSILKHQNEENAAKRIAFDKRQAKRATAHKTGVAQKSATGGGSTHISVDENGRSTNWVLFDALHEFPPIHGPTPELFQRLSRFTPGNAKIVAYNTESFNISLRKTPAFFAGCRVEYHKTGPLLVRMRGESPEVPEITVDSPVAGLIAGEQIADE